MHGDHLHLVVSPTHVRYDPLEKLFQGMTRRKKKKEGKQEIMVLEGQNFKVIGGKTSKSLGGKTLKVKEF